jgi:hypothetical protein
MTPSAYVTVMVATRQCKYCRMEVVLKSNREAETGINHSQSRCDAIRLGGR